eukprot:TRINITY_DN8740_c0_g2_i1.p1 TRINITY_DN8740_c0_g2~~TRINITY_DN8740_c0_g2_i1.p1  ORF type:complete len:254 (+),score=50.01 TRINITY_DN8740_c0_g2_i1:41-802(+)
MASAVRAIQSGTYDSSILEVTTEPLSDAQLDELEQALSASDCKDGIRRLQMDRNSITDAGRICAIVQQCTSLSELMVTRNQLAASGVALLAPCLSQLRLLDLSRNFLADDGFSLLVNALKDSPTLEELRLRENGLSPDSGVLVVKLLNQNELSHLDLGLNELEDSGAMAIAQAIADSSSLTHLNLDSNYITAIGAEALAQQIAVSSSFASLSIEDNKLRDEGVSALEAVLEISSSFKHLSTRGNKARRGGTSI